MKRVNFGLLYLYVEGWAVEASEDGVSKILSFHTIPYFRMER